MAAVSWSSLQNRAASCNRAIIDDCSNIIIIIIIIIISSLSAAKIMVWTLSAAYMSQTRDQQRFTISEVAADWHEPMVPQRIMWPSIARATGQLDPRCS